MNINNKNYNNELNASCSNKLLFIENNNEQIDSSDIEKKNNKDEEKEKEKIKEKENNSFLYNKHISINNGNSFWMAKNNIQEKKEDSILSSLSLIEKDIIYSNNYLQSSDANQTFY